LIYALEVGHGSADEIIEAFVGIYPALKESLMQAIRQIERRGEVRGIQRGMQEGMQQGIQQGRQEGMQTRNWEIARKMLQTGESIEKIARWTGLSEASIRSL
ncbi:MAG: ISNCY family transposase, partial [Bacteroidota bacterium]